LYLDKSKTKNVFVLGFIVKMNSWDCYLWSMILIADAGNTKTAWALAGAGKHPLFHRSSGISPYFDAPEKITTLALEAGESLGCPSVASVRYYGSGCSRPDMQGKVEKALKAAFPDADILVQDDLTGAGMALFGPGSGIACILGTGSNAGVYQSGTITERPVSLGYLLGDEGSGAHIGFGFLKLLLSGALDQPLSQRFYQQHETNPDQLLSHLYQAPKPQAFAASVIPFIAGCSEVPVINSLIRRSFKEFVDIMVVPLLQSHQGLHAGFCGSIPSLFQPILKGCMDEQGIPLSGIIPDPITALAAHFSQ